MSESTPPVPVSKDALAAVGSNDVPALAQVGAMPLRFKDGKPEVLLVTSRESRRWVIPKGWPMKGRKDWAAAAREAQEEAGIIGKAYKKPVGSYLYFKRRAAHFDLCRVEVYVLLFGKKLTAFREKGQRESRWFSLTDAAEQVQEPGLAALLGEFDALPFRKPSRRKD